MVVLVPLSDGGIIASAMIFQTVASPFRNSDARLRAFFSTLPLCIDPDMETRIGKLSGWVFRTGDCQATYTDLLAKGVRFTEKPTAHIWGIQALFEDPYGNQFVLLQPTA